MTRKLILVLVFTFVLLGNGAFVNGEQMNPAKKTTVMNTITEKKVDTGNNKPVKMIFIHHSVGGRWLAHDHGGLAHELNRYNYYVNDITYGWEPRELTNTLWKRVVRKIISWFGLDGKGIYGIGNRTDIGHWYEWFNGKNRDRIMGAVYKENGETQVFGNHENRLSRFPVANPGEEIENEIVMIKPCYPNSLYRGSGNDGPATGNKPPRNFPAGSEQHTVANCKRIFNDILAYFKTRPDKFFVIITAPPRTELPDNGVTARAFNNWVIYQWLKENNYTNKNVMVFDLFNVLTSGNAQAFNDLGQEEGNHHRLWKDKEQHVVQVDNNLLFYPRDKNDNHPSKSGLEKATAEFVPILENRYRQWKKSAGSSN